jgi:Protein of unknown function (DUF1579)
LLLVLFSLTIVAVPQTKPEPLDGPNRPFHDELLDNLQGKWKIYGIIMGKPREMELTAEWVLNHQFLFVHEQDAATVEGKQSYDANIYIGYDNASERYVIHWIDIFGGRFSETLGYGTRSGSSIKFVFEYPDGPFHNTFTWNPETKTWRFLLEQKNAEGKWTVFADQTANKVK